MDEQAELAFTDPTHPVGLRMIGDDRLEIGWGGEGRVIAAKLSELRDRGAVRHFVSLVREAGLPEATEAKIRFLEGILDHRIGTA